MSLRADLVRRTRRRGVVSLLVAVVVVAIGAALAFGYWTTTGSGSASATTGTLNAPTVQQPSATGGTVHVTWTAPAGGTAPSAYYVTRTNTSTSTTVAACNTSAAQTTTSLSCDDTGVPSGTYTYAVTAVYHSWTAKGTSPSVTVSAAAKLAFTTQPSATATAGTTLGTQPVVTVQDAGGNTVTADSSSVTLALTAANGATLTCTANPKAASGGVAAFAGCRIDKVGTYTLTASDGSLTSAVSASITVSAGAAAKLAFTTQPSAAAAAGATFATQPVVTVQDAAGNTATSDASSVTLALTTPAGASLSCTTNPKSAVSGVAPFAGCRIDKPGTYTLTASDGSLTSAVSASVTVSAGAAARLAFTTQPSTTATAATAFGVQPVVTVQDAGGNTVTSDSSSVTLALTAANGATLTCTVNPKPASSGVATFAGCAIDKTGTYTLTATDGSLTSAVSTSITVSVGASAKLAFTTQPSANATGGTTLSAQPVVTVLDAGGNTVTADASSVTLALTTPGGATLTCTTNPKPASSGVATFAGCRIDKVGTYTLTATDASLTSAVSTSITVSAGAAASFLVSPSTNSPAAGVAFTVVLTAVDAGGNTATSFTGSQATAWSGATTSPAGNAPTYPSSSISFTAGVSGPLPTTLFSAGPNPVTASHGVVAGTTSLTVSPANASDLLLSTVTMRAGSSTNSLTPSCTISSTTNSVCTTASGLSGNSRSATTSVVLTDPYGNAVTAAAAIAITLASTGNVTGFAPSATTTIAAGTTTSPSFSASISNGGQPGTFTAKATVNGTATTLSASLG